MSNQITKANRVTSIQSRFDSKSKNYAFSDLSGFVNRTMKAPIYGDPRRDYFLADIWKEEPILAGALNVMVKRMRACGYTVEGGRNNAMKWARILQDADGGNGWQNFIARWVQDYLTTDLGALFEIGRDSNGAPAGIFNIDSLKCSPWPEPEYPMVYFDMSGKVIKLPKKDLVHFSDMTSAREQDMGRGLCAVSRVLRGGEAIMAIHDYELQKLGKLPPLAVASIRGITYQQFQDAWTLYKKQREKEELDVYSGIFWIGSEDPSIEVGVDLTDIAKLPDQFDRDKFIESWVKTIALNMGVDVGELWLIQHVGATKASQSIQHQKALGKGTGEICAMLESALNTKILPADAMFAFDFQDDDQDMQAASIMELKINNLMALYTQSSRGASKLGGIEAPFTRSGAGNLTPTGVTTAQTQGQQDQTPPLITRDQAIELGTQWGVFPAGFFGQEVATVAGMILKKAGVYREDDMVVVTSDMKVYEMDTFRKRKHYTDSAKLLLSKIKESGAEYLLEGVDVAALKGLASG